MVPILFYSDPNFRILSNFFMADQEVDNVVYGSNEHFFQAQKTLDPVWRERIRLAHTCPLTEHWGGPRPKPCSGVPVCQGGHLNPARAKKLGRQAPMRPGWDQDKYGVMRVGLRAKFAIPRLREFLLATGDRPIYEDSPSDRIWGTGSYAGTGPGLNLMGKLLMEIRTELRNPGVAFKDP